MWHYIFKLPGDFFKKTKQNYKHYIKNYTYCIAQECLRPCECSQAPHLCLNYFGVFYLFPSSLSSFSSILQPTSRFVLRKQHFITSFSCSVNYWLSISHHIKWKLLSRQSWHFTIRSTLFTQPHLRLCSTMKPYTTSVGLPFTFPNYSTVSYFLVSTQSFPFFFTQQWKVFPVLFNCTLLRFQDPT